MLEFATGKISVLEKRLLDRNDLERMLKAPDYKNAFLVLYDTDLDEVIDEKKETERWLEEDLVVLKNNLWMMLKDECPELFQFLFLRFDALNLKIILKKSSENNFALASIEPFEKLKDFVERKIKSSLEKLFFEEKMNLTVKKMTENSLFRLDKIREKKIDDIEQIVEEEYFKRRILLAKPYPFLREAIKFEIDLINLKKALRKKEKEKLIPGGNLTTEEIFKIVNLKEEELASKSHLFGEILSLYFLVNKIKKLKDEKLIESAIDNFFSSYIFERERIENSGMPKVVACFIRKINAQKNIRLILWAKKYQIPISEIEPKLLLI